MKRMSLLLLIGLLSVVASNATAADTESSLLSNGNFEQLAEDKSSPRDWPSPEGVSWQKEDRNHFLHLEADPERLITVYRSVPVPPGAEAFRFRFRLRVNDLAVGKENWHDGRIILDFKDAAGAKLKSGAPHPNFKGNSKGWVEREVDFLVPESAVTLEVMPAVFWSRSGSYDIDDLSLTLADSAPIIARIEAAKKKRAEEIARRAALVKPQVPEARPEQLPPALHVEGNQVLDADGETVWLQGVSIPSLEWSAGGDQVLRSVEVAIDDWKANVIRLCIRENFWNGVGPYQGDGGAGYRQLITDAINLAGSRGVYTVLDLHRFRAPEPIHAEFWTALATRFANHPAVLFELFNEPHDLSWKTWRDGGFVSEDPEIDPETLAENREKLKGFESIGMQALVDAVREAGAKNLVIAGGLDWSYDLSGILDGYALDDRNGNGIVYSTHVYPWKSDWQGMFMKVAEAHPIFIGECGASEERMSFIPPERHEDPATWVPDFLGLVQAHRYHWTAWSFHPKASPCLLSDFDYTPTPYWGAKAKAALAGENFQMTRVR